MSAGEVCGVEEEREGRGQEVQDTGIHGKKILEGGMGGEEEIGEEVKWCRRMLGPLAEEE